MQITLFGVIWISLLMFVFFNKDLRHVLTMALFSMVLQCNNVISFGATAVGVQAFTILVALIRFALLPQKTGQFERDEKSLFTAPLLLMVYMLISSLLIHGQFSENWLKIFIIVIYVLFAFVVYNKRLTVGIDEQWIEKTIDSIVIFVLVVGVLQYLACAGVSFLRPLLTTSIFNDTANTDVIFHSKPTYAAMYSTFMEPSYFAVFMVGMFAMISMRKNASSKNVFLLLAIGLAIVVSRSSTGYGGLAIILAIQAIVFSQKKPVVRVIVPLAVVAGFFVVLFNYELLDKVILSKNQTSSYSVRMRWNEWAWEDFLESPLFGVGIGKSRASSLFYTLLAELGVVGFLFYMRLILKDIKLLFSKNKSYLVTGAAFSILSIWICQIIACPDMNLSPFWMMVFVMAISCNLNSNVVDFGGKERL